MSNQTGFYSHCPDCGAKLRSHKRLENHRKSRCNELKWKRKRSTGGRKEVN